MALRVVERHRCLFIDCRYQVTALKCPAQSQMSVWGYYATLNDLAASFGPLVRNVSEQPGSGVL